MAVKDDEQDIPFRWSLFLPAAGDTPSMRMLKYAVIGMGIVLILGFFIILARIVYLTSRMDASLPAGQELSIAVPAGAEVTSMSLAGNRLALHLAGPGPNERSIVVIDLASGRVVSRMRLEPGASPEAISGGAPAPSPPR
ncbi:MAG: DUF6476 family protein [Hyphomicrobiaceae bacterium]